MVNFKSYYWQNTKRFIAFTALVIIVAAFFPDIETFLIIFGFLAFINIVMAAGNYVAWKKYKKNNPND